MAREKKKEDVGRPSKYDEAKKQRTVWLTQSAWESLAQEAKNQGLSVSEYLEQMGRKIDS